MVWRNIGDSLSPFKQVDSCQAVSAKRKPTKPRSFKERVLPLHFAICNKLTTEIRCLIEEGCDVNSRDQYKRTALMLCCIENDEKWSVGVVTMLLQAGANVALCDANGKNALIFATIFSRRKIVDLLLTAIDYDIYQPDSNDRTAFDYATMQGDKDIIRTISSAFDFENASKFSELRQRIRPLALDKSIMQLERSRNHVHRSSSDMNVHQFRRETMNTFWLRSSMRAKFVSFETPFKPVSSDITSTSRRQKSTQSVPPVSTNNSISTVNDFPEVDMNNSKRCWKSSVPAFWQILSIQCSPSYRNSAKVSLQSSEEALGLPPKELEDGEVLPDADTSSNTSSGQSPPRRSSMPAPTSQPQAVIASRAERRRSEASLGISLTSATKLVVSEQKVTKRLEALVELRRAKEALDSKVSFQSINERNRINNENNRSVIIDGGEPMPLLSTKSRTEGVDLKKSSRTPITRNRPGSALRQQLPLSSKSSRVERTPVVDADNGQERISPIESNTNISRINSSTNDLVSELVSLKSENRLSENTTEAHLTKISGEEKDQSSSKKLPRRGSILLRERVLADIVEENEVSHGAWTAENTVPSPSLRPDPLRSAPALVRGRTYSGRRIRR